METNNKPDFEKMAREYAETFKTGEWFENIRTDAGKVIGEKIWNDYVILERSHNKSLRDLLQTKIEKIDALCLQLDERDAKISELEHKVGDLVGSNMETRGEVLQLKSENQALKSELLDTLDLKEGNGPTALSAERERLKSKLDKATKLLLIALLIVYRSGDYTDEHAAIKNFLGCKSDHGDDFEKYH